PAPRPGRVRQALQRVPATPGPESVTATPTVHCRRSRRAAPYTPKTDPRRADQRIRTRRIDHQAQQVTIGIRVLSPYTPLSTNHQIDRPPTGYPVSGRVCREELFGRPKLRYAVHEASLPDYRATRQEGTGGGSATGVLVRRQGLVP